MRTSDIIRAVLDLLDREEETTVTTCDEEPPEQGEPIASRFRQIVAMLDNPNHSSLSNTPNEVVADVDAVTTDAGGGVNGPKHVDDIRVKDPRGYE